MTEFGVMTVRELIDSLFGEARTNKVNFKMFKSVLLILARQLSLLERKVKVEKARQRHRDATMKVTEVKIHAKKSKKGGKGVKIGVTEKKTPQQTAKDKSSKGKSGEKDKSSSDKSSINKSGEKDKSSSDKSSIDKSGEKSSSADTSSTDTTTSTTSQSTTSTSTTSSASDKSKEESDDSIRGKKRKGQSLDETEQMEVIQEKLLIVSRTSSGTEIADTVVTQDQCNALVAEVRKLQAKFGLKDGDLILPFGGLYKQTSMTDPMAIVQMSARLEAAENKLAKMMSIALELCRNIPEIDIESAFDDKFLKEAAPKGFGPLGPSAQTPQQISRKGKSAAFTQPPSTVHTQTSEHVSPDYDSESEMEADLATFEAISVAAADLDISSVIQGVTFKDLNERFGELQNEVMKHMTGVSKRIAATANAAHKTLNVAGVKLDEALNLGDSFNKLDFAVQEYAERINILDSKITVQMIEYQDALTQMQYDLEVSLDALAEALAAPSDEAAVAAIAELNGYFSAFQLDLDDTAEKIREGKYFQKDSSINLKDLTKKIKVLQEIKCTRDEITDALSDKAGIASLNGMVSMEQFEAVRGDFEKRIRSAYDKFNNKEIHWQKCIDEFIRELNEKSDYIQMVTVNDEIGKYTSLMREALHEMLAIVGELDANPNTKKVERFDNCISCGTPANFKPDMDLMELMLTLPPAVGAETVNKMEEDDNIKKCMPGHPIPHAIDPRSLVCQRHCGAPFTPAKPSLPVIIEKLDPLPSTSVGTDGKVNLTDAKKKPCLLCNKPELASEGSLINECRCNSISSSELITRTWVRDTLK